MQYFSHIGIPQISILAVTLVLFYLAKVAKNIATPYDLNHEIQQNNIAAAASLSGYFIATMAILIGAFLGPTVSLQADLISYGAYGLFGIVLLNLARFINDKLILRHFSNVKEIIEDKNAGTGAVEFGSYVASGLVIAGAIHGEGGSWVTALGTYFLAQITLILFTWIYDLITPFQLHEKIEADNVAVGIVFGGTLTALGIILLRAGAGDFHQWEVLLTQFGLTALTGMILLPLFRLVVDRLFFRGFSINDEIANHSNIAVALCEASMTISFAGFLFFILDFS